MLRRVGLLTVFLACAAAVLGVGPRPSFASSKKHEVDLEVFMEVDASGAEVAAVEQAIRTTPDVRGFLHLDKARAYAEFKRIFAGQKDLLESMEPADLPESFRLDVVDGHKEDVKRTLQSLPGVRSIKSPGSSFRLPSARDIEQARKACARQRYDVFMNVGATTEQLGAARSAIDADHDVELLHVIDPATALQRLRKWQPDLVDDGSVTARDLPTTFEVRLKSEHVSAVIARLRSLDGVEEVQNSARASCALVKFFS